MLPQPDYPAAHSMDTDWFAVDRDGNLAFFDSGEEAAVPRQILQQDHGFDILDEIMIRAPWRLLENARGHHVVEKGTPEWEDLLPREITVEDEPTKGPFSRFWRRLTASAPVRESYAPHLLDVVLLLKDREILRRLRHSDFKTGDSVETGGDRLTPVRFASLPGDEYRLMHDADACIACAARASRTRANTLGHLGVFIYEAPEYGNPPYKLVSRPQRSLLLEDLPADLRTRAELVRFQDVSFAEAEHLQPIEHVLCKTYSPGPEATYLASDLKTRRPVPPQER